MTPLSTVLRGTLSGGATTIGKSPPPSVHRHASLGKDNGAINLLRVSYPCLSTHSSIKELGDSLVKAYAQEPGSHPMFHPGSFILGHGGPGYVEVGAGQWGRSWERSIWLENEEVWAPQFARLWVPPKIERHPHWGEIPRFRSIQFLSCSTAASPEGRELLQRIADVGNLRVSAGTGLLIATSQYAFWEKGAQIACCVPRDAARPNGYVECPEGNWREPSALADANFQFMGMKNLGFGPGMEVADVESISVKTPSSNDEIELPKEEAAELLPLIFSSPPYAKDGELTAALTARFTVKYRSQPAITVDLLADRLAQVDVQRVFLVAQGIRAFLKRFGIS